MTEMVHVSQHPLVQHKLSVLRDESTDHRSFRELMRELALLLVYEATLDLKLAPRDVKTPMGIAKGFKNEEPIGLVPGTAGGTWDGRRRADAAAECAGLAYRPLP